jgi:hypothetical protein
LISDLKLRYAGLAQSQTQPYTGVFHVAYRATPQPSAEPKLTDTRLTIPVPEAGQKYFGLSRNASYAAAARGDIPTIKIGKLLRVPVRALEQMLDKAAPSHVA